MPRQRHMKAGVKWLGRERSEFVSVAEGSFCAVGGGGEARRTTRMRVSMQSAVIRRLGGHQVATDALFWESVTAYITWTTDF